MNYRSAVDWILSFADYERFPGFFYSSRFDLRRVEKLLDKLGKPHLGPRTIHLAGTKGKGSTAALLTSGLKAAKFKVGLYTSPHLHTIRERICLDKKPITEKEFARLATELKPAAQEINRDPFGELTTFELLTALGFLYFQRSGADFQVLETGLGGRLDATNVVHPEICVITSISRDHTKVLGDSLAQIAAEKAGIIKSGTLTVSAPQKSEVTKVIEEKCAQRCSRLIKVGEEITWRELASTPFSQSLEVRGIRSEYKLSIPLLGKHQQENTVVATTVLEILGLNSETVCSGFSRVNWPGRLEVLAQQPWLIADGAHNADSAAKLRETLKQYFHFDRAILIFAASWDKDISGVVTELAPFFQVVIITRSHHPRSADPLRLAEEFERHGAWVQVTDNVEQAIAAAKSRAKKEDLICVTGSLFVVAEVRGWAKGLPVEYYPLQETVAQKGGM